MKIATAFLVAVTVLTRFQESFTLPGKLFTSAANGISSLVDQSKSVVSDVAETVNSAITVEISEADKQLVNDNIIYCEEALARAKKICADALLNATGVTKASIAAAAVYVDTIIATCDVLHPQIKAAIESASKLALQAVVVESSLAIKASEAILATFDEYFLDEAVKVGVSREIRTVLDYSGVNIELIKSCL